MPKPVSHIACQVLPLFGLSENSPLNIQNVQLIPNLGKESAVRRYIQHAPQSDFDAIDRESFMRWFSGTASEQPLEFTQQPPQISGFQAINAPNNRSVPTRPRDSSPPETTLNRAKRPRIADNERPPCLRCKILKKRVGFSLHLLSTTYPCSAIPLTSVITVQGRVSKTKTIFGRF